jgi:hypothetical protein
VLQKKRKEEKKRAGHRWLTPVILATQEAEIRRITVPSQPAQIVCETLSQKNPSQKRAGGVAQGAGPELKLQYCKKRDRNPVFDNVTEFFYMLAYFLTNCSISCS